MNAQEIDCLSVLGLLWDYLDHELASDVDESIRQHLATCTGCTEHIAFCRSFLDLLAAAPIEARDVASVRQRVWTAIDRAGAT